MSSSPDLHMPSDADGSSTTSASLVPAAPPAAGQRPERLSPTERILLQVVERQAAHDAHQLAALGEAAWPRLVMLAPDGAGVPGDASHAVLGRRLGRGGRHSAHVIDQVVAGTRAPSDWVAVILRQGHDAGPPPAAGSQRFERALAEHEHARAVLPSARDLLPPYGGLGAVLSSARQMPAPEGRLRFATLWGRQDGTLKDLMQAGGLAGQAVVPGLRLGAGDVGKCMLLLGSAYERLHHRGLVYTDPKPGNLAYTRGPGLSPDQAAALGPDPLGAGSSRIQDLLFIDVEAMQAPGYAGDRSRRASTNLTPLHTSEDILAQVFIGEGALKRAQADPRNDVRHMAMLSYGLVTGRPPQHAVAEERLASRLDARERMSPAECARTAVDEMRLVRREAGYGAEHARLAALAEQGVLPRRLGQVISDGLEGRIASPQDWLRRTRTALADPDHR